VKMLRSLINFLIFFFWHFAFSDIQKVETKKVKQQTTMAKNLLVFFTLFCCVFSAAFAAEAIAFGDSWAALFGGSLLVDEFEEMFHSRGHNITVKNIAIGGTTAAYWAGRPDFLANNIDNDTRWVWVCIGGNDGIYGLPGTPIDEIVEKAIEDTQQFFDPVREQFGDSVKLVMFGYDIIDFCGSCSSLGNQLFGPYCDRNDLSCWNTQMQALQYDYVEGLAQIYPDSFLVTRNLLGTMQQASGEVPPPFPNIEYCTPSDHMSDCIHPNSQGYTALFDQLWEVYFKDEI